MVFSREKTWTPMLNSCPVLYDDVFERILKHWSDLGESLSNSVPIMPDVVDKAMDYLQKSDDGAWNIQYAGDVILYWGFRLFQQRVVLRVLAQITKKIADTIATSSQVPGYHILSHSLGTAVVHDALHHLGTEDWLGALAHAQFSDEDGPTGANDLNVYLNGLKRLQSEFGIANPFHPSLFQFETITMLSNVSGLIHSFVSPYNSIVRPGSASAESAFTKSYINVNHDYDPISIVGNFKMPKAWEMQGGVDLKVDHVLFENIHSAAHYVAHPNVHLRLLQSYVDPYFATEKDIKMVATFQRQYGIKNLAEAMLKDTITSLVNIDGEGIDKIMKAIEMIERLM